MGFELSRLPSARPPRIVVRMLPLPETNTLSASLLEWLDESERHRAGEFAGDRPRLAFVMSRLVLRRALSEILSGEPKSWRFARERSGKWKLKGEALAEVSFSTSHCAGAVAVAISRDVPVGIDIEGTGPTPPAGELDAALAPGERRWLGERGGSRETLLGLWTAKEAYTKLVGLGPELDPGSFEITGSPPVLKKTAPELPAPDKVHLTGGEWVADTGSFCWTLASLKEAGGEPEICQRIWKRVEP